MLQSTAAVFTNGFVFDELPLELVKQAIRMASDAGAAVLFDPGGQAVGARCAKQAGVEIQGWMWDGGGC